MAVMYQKCNHCNLERVKEAAKARGMETTVIDNEVYVHPHEVDVEGMGPVERTMYWVVRFTAIPPECFCHLKGR